MNTSEKKYKGSVIAIICYVLAALLLIYTCYQAGNTVATIKEYYSQYQMKASASEYVTYILQSALEPFINTVVLFVLGYIINEVRKNNPANYVSKEKMADAAAAEETAEYKDAADSEIVTIEEETAADEKPVTVEFIDGAKAEEDTAGPKEAESKTYEPKTELKADDDKAEKTEAQNRDRKPAQKKQGAAGNNNRNNNSRDRKPAARKDGETKKDGEAKGETKKEGSAKKEGEAKKSEGNSKDKKPAPKKQNSGNKPKKPAESKQNQKAKAKKSGDDEETVSIPWEVNADFTEDIPDNE